MAYITAQDLFDEFGERNVHMWADASGKGTSIEDKISNAIVEAEGLIDGRLYGLGYELPLRAVAGELTPLVKFIAKGLVLKLLRAHRTSEEESDKWAGRIKEAEDLLVGVLAGSVRLPCARRTWTHRCPTVV